MTFSAAGKISLAIRGHRISVSLPFLDHEPVFRSQNSQWLGLPFGFKNDILHSIIREWRAVNILYITMVI